MNYLIQNIYINGKKIKNQIGITEPIDLKSHLTGILYQTGGAEFLQTQTFVSRKNMVILGYYFP